MPNTKWIGGILLKNYMQKKKKKKTTCRIPPFCFQYHRFSCHRTEIVTVIKSCPLNCTWNPTSLYSEIPLPPVFFQWYWYIASRKYIKQTLFIIVSESVRSLYYFLIYRTSNDFWKLPRKLDPSQVRMYSDWKSLAVLWGVKLIFHWKTTAWDLVEI